MSARATTAAEAPASRPVRVLHIISGLTTGGAEMMLYKLLREMDRDRFQPAVVSLLGRGTIGARIEAGGTPVYPLELRGPVAAAPALVRLSALVRRLRPDLIQGWLPHGNLAASFAGLARPRAKVLWNVRQSLDDLDNEKRGTRLAIRGGARLSRRPAAIIYNSRNGARQHERIGYAPERTRLIPNGFDPDLFRPRPEARTQLRRELGLDDSAQLVGMISRFHPMKGFGTFFQAAGRVAPLLPGVHFVLAGRGVLPDDPELSAMVSAAGLRGRVHLLGERADTPILDAALDLATLSSSWGEGFPNVMGEAMACGVPCVVTDVGDSAWVVGETGIAVPPNDPAALAEAWLQVLRAPAEHRQRLGAAARRRVVEHFSLRSIAGAYEALYAETLGGPRARRPGRAPEPAPVPARAAATAPPMRRVPRGADARAGALVISLDFELHWGVRDLMPATGHYHANLLGARRAVPRMLRIFEEFGIGATWATVGFLFARSRAELIAHSPSKRPSYRDPHLDPYMERLGDGEADDPLHFAPSLIDAIAATPRQEIATHTFSHYYCLEPGQGREMFAADLASAVAIAAARGIELRSIVFPRNQHNPEYDDLLLDAGIVCYRGNQTSRIYRASEATGERRWMRLSRLADAYLDVSGPGTTTWASASEASGLCNLPASRFLRPYARGPRAGERLRLRRVADAMRHAARTGEIFHLWWHPHNFGSHLEENLRFLRQVLEVFDGLRRSAGMRSLNMQEAAALARSAAAARSPRPVAL